MAKKAVTIKEEENTGEIMGVEKRLINDTFEIPYGYMDEEGNLHKEVHIIEIGGAAEEEIAKAEVRTNIGKIVTTLLSYCVDRIGTLEKSSMKPSKWEKIFRNMYLGDRDTILFNITLLTHFQGDEENKELSFDSRCPVCRQQSKICFDPDEIKILPVKDDPGKIPFELPRGYRHPKTGIIYKSGLLKMPTGFDQELLDTQARKNPAVANTSLLTRCVYEMGDLNLNSKVFRDLNKRDREYILEVISEHVFGPRFILDVICENCGAEFEAGVHPINFM